MMKTVKYILSIIFVAFLINACNNGIDDITQVNPGADETAPSISIVYPTEGTEIKVFEDVTSIEIEIKVTDDIEIKDIKVQMDGNQIALFDSFTDYRIAIEKFTFDNLTDGDHKLTVVATDLEGKTTTKEVNFKKSPPYIPMFDGEVLYMPFDDDYMDLISFNKAAQVGTPGFAGTSYVGTNAYQGATDSYLTFPLDNLKSNEISGAFWYKVNATPDRAGILVVGNDVPENRKQGFRLFREADGANQRIKLNVGTGDGESWNDGGVIDVSAGEWVHIAFSISGTESKIFFNGVEMLSATLSAPLDWTGCETLTIGSGAPSFTYWNHNSDASPMDELRLFDKALTQADVQIMINALNPYIPKFDGESLYMPFDGDYIDQIGMKAAVTVGSPGFTNDNHDGGSAYLGATDSYITYPSDNLKSSEFSAAFWYKVNASPDRAGLIVIGTDIAEDRTKGFRLFREGSATEQRIKLNVGTGSGESWNDGDVIDPSAGDWVHVVITIANDKNTIYFNGVEVRSSDMSAPIDWTGVGDFSIGSGVPSFEYWNHKSDSSPMDELRFFDKALSAAEVQEVYGGGYVPAAGETFYMPFNGSNAEVISGTMATMEGTPGFAGEGKLGGNAYAGATDSYLTFPTDGLLGTEFSATFWYKLNADPDRAGILVVGPPDTENAGYPDVQNKRTSGFRFFRESANGGQTFKLNAGNGTADSWFDGGATATLDPATDTDWVHIAFTISGSECVIYFDGEVVSQGSFTGIDWSGCDILSIMSGAPRFTEWNHFSDNSYLDELHLYNKALTQAEIQAML